MIRVLIFGNSGSGKSTLAKRYAALPEVAHLDLDSVAWKTNQPGVREELSASYAAINRFLNLHAQWVIEGCYSSLIQHTAPLATELLFLNPGLEACQVNCRSRPWEPHKYPSKSAQDENLSMLLSWVADYQTRDDEFSLSAHRSLFDHYNGPKRELNSNREVNAISKEIGGDRSNGTPKSGP